MTNGRATQQELYAAIGDLRKEQREGFADVKRDIRDLAERVRGVELQQVTELAHDDERKAMLQEAHEIRIEQGVGRRWLIGIAVTVTFSAIASAFSIAHALGFG